MKPLSELFPFKYVGGGYFKPLTKETFTAAYEGIKAHSEKIRNERRQLELDTNKFLEALFKLDADLAWEVEYYVKINGYPLLPPRVYEEVNRVFSDDKKKQDKSLDTEKAI